MIAPILTGRRQLQVNLSGAWKTVLQFDESEIERVKQGARLLYEAAAPLTPPFRIVTIGGNPTVMMYLSSNSSGMWCQPDWLSEKNKGA